MTNNADKLQNYLAKYPINYGDDDVDSLLKMLYTHYAEDNPIDNEQIRTLLRSLHDCLWMLSEDQFEEVFGVVCDLCVEHQDVAFISGLRTGMQLALEVV